MRCDLKANIKRYTRQIGFNAQSIFHFAIIIIIIIIYDVMRAQRRTIRGLALFVARNLLSEKNYS